LQQQWLDMPEDQKTQYQVIADSTSERVRDLEQKSFAELVEDPSVNSLTQKVRSSVLRCALKRTLDDMHQHPWLRGGLGLMSMEAGLRQELVDVTKSNEMMKTSADRRFAYSPKSEPHHVGSLKPEKVCVIANAGLCKKHPRFKACTDLTKNLYAVLRTRYKKAENIKEALPLLARFSFTTTATEYHWICKVAISVSLIVLTEAMVVDGGDAKIVLQTTDDVDTITTTSNLVFARLLHRAAEAGAVDPTNMRAIIYNVKRPPPGDTGNEFCREIDGVLIDRNLPTGVQLQVPKEAPVEVPVVELPFIGAVAPRPEVPPPAPDIVDHALTSDDDLNEDDQLVDGRSDFSSDHDDPVEMTEEDEEPAPLPVPRATPGVQGWDIAASDRTVCTACGERVPKGSLRLFLPCENHYQARRREKRPPLLYRRPFPRNAGS